MSRTVVIHPDTVVSPNDGERHFVDHDHLKRLYGVQRSHRCLSADSITYEARRRITTDLHLYPRANGNYVQVDVWASDDEPEPASLDPIVEATFNTLVLEEQERRRAHQVGNALANGTPIGAIDATLSSEDMASLRAQALSMPVMQAPSGFEFSQQPWADHLQEQGGNAVDMDEVYFESSSADLPTRNDFITMGQLHRISRLPSLNNIAFPPMLSVITSATQVNIGVSVDSIMRALNRARYLHQPREEP